MALDVGITFAYTSPPIVPPHTSSLSRGTSTWWRLLLPPVTQEQSIDGYQKLPAAGPQDPDAMAAALFHLASSSTAAWSALARVFWHGLACPVVLTDAGFR